MRSVGLSWLVILGVIAMEFCPEPFAFFMHVLGRFGKFPLDPAPYLPEEGNLIGQQVDPEQQGEQSLPRGHQHDEAQQDAKPTGCMLEY